MCVVSMVMDHYHDKWYDRWNRHIHPVVPVPMPVPTPVPVPVPSITPEEVEEFKKLLERARAYDRKNGEPDCELDEKRQALKKIAQEMGVDISFV